MENRMVSVVIPTYNRGKLIKRAIDSVLKQTYKNFEIIIIDDASTDSTDITLTSYDDSRIKYYRNTVNIGANGSRNIGIKRACGEIIAFLDSDNEWNEKKLEAQLVKLQGEVYWGFSSFIYDKGGVKKKILEEFDEINIQKNHLKNILKIRNIVDTNTLIVNKDKLLRIGLFDESMPRMQDYELAIRLVENYNYFYISDNLVTTYFTKESINTNHKAFLTATGLILNKHKNFFDKGSIQKQLQRIIKYCANNTIEKEDIRAILEKIKELNMISKEEYAFFIESTLVNLLNDSGINQDWLRNHREYLKTILMKQQKYYIYGTGKKAKELYSEIEDYADNLKAFVVTSSIDGEVTLFSKSIIEAVRLKEEKDILIIVATDCKYFEEIEENLKFHGFENIYFWN